MRKLALFGVLGFLLLGGLVLFAPWKDWVTRLIKDSLKTHGLTDVQLTVDTLGFDGITFTSVTIPQKTDMVMQQATIGYSLIDLLQGQLHQLELRDVVLTQKNMVIKLNRGVFVFQSTDQKDRWGGTWLAENMQAQPLPIPVPDLSGDGTFDITANKLIIKGEMTSIDSQYKIIFSTDYYFTGLENVSNTGISHAEFPWNGGTIFVRDGWVPFAGPDLFRGNIDVKDVRLHLLLKSLTGDRAGGRGVVSGRIPITIDKDGTPIIHNATLNAGSNGRIYMAEDAIPEGNEQLGVVRNVLSNFHYNSLSITLGTDANKKLSARMIVEGRNPNQYQGRPIKLNVQLTGDVLSLLQQSVPTITDPTQLLKQGEHAKP